MRVSCYTIDEFLTCLAAALEDGSVFERAVRVNIVRRHDPSKARSDVVLQATAIVQTAGGGEYLLEVGINCGRDFHDAKAAAEGSQKADELKATIAAFTDANTLRLLPGVIGF